MVKYGTKYRPAKVGNRKVTFEVDKYGMVLAFAPSLSKRTAIGLGKTKTEALAGARESIKVIKYNAKGKRIRK